MKNILKLDAPCRVPANAATGVKTWLSAGARVFSLALCATLGWSSLLHAATTVSHPFVGITAITDTETSPRSLTMHIIKVDLTAAGIGVKLAPPTANLPLGTSVPYARETVRQTTSDYLTQEGAQVGVNCNFFLPFPTTDTTANLVGLAVSNGNVYSPFEAPVQSYAIVNYAPAINIDPNNIASVVHADTSFADGMHVLENVTLWNAFAGSAQIITNGVASVPVYKDATHPNGLLTTNGTYTNSNSWYNVLNARTVAGLSQDNKTLFLFTVDKAAGSGGMTGTEAANFLIGNYGVYNALNLDGGGSTTMVMQNPLTRVEAVVNVSANDAQGDPRAEGSNIAVFAQPVSAQIGVTVSGLVYSRATGKYTGTLVLTNDGADLTGKIDVALQNLSSGVTLVNTLGQYNGAPYTSVANSGLATGASLTVPVAFSNPTNLKINFTPVTFQE